MVNCLKKAICILLVFCGMMLFSCGERPPTDVDTDETFRWDVEERDTAPETENKETLSGETEYDEDAYHESIGIQPLDQSFYDHILDYYNVRTYEGQSSYVTDILYRTKLDLEKLIREKYHISLYSQLVDLIESYLENKEVRYLLPTTFHKNGWIGSSWATEIYHLLMDYEDQAVQDETLISVFRYYLYMEGLSDNSIKVDGSYLAFADSPRLVELLFPPEIINVAQYYDAKLGRTVLTVEGTGIERVAYEVNKNKVILSDNGCTVLDIDQPFTLLPNFEGTVAINAMDALGVLGKTYVYQVKSEKDNIPNHEVELTYEPLERRVRQFLGKDEDDVIMSHDLLAITSIRIRANEVLLNGESSISGDLNPPMVEEQLISFKDFDAFYLLDNLSIDCHKIDAVEGTRTCHVEWLSITRSELSDISFLNGGSVRYLDLGSNCIENATCLESLPYLTSVYVANNPLSRIDLPKRSIGSLNISYTDLESLDFLSDIIGLSFLNCQETEITDVTILLSLRGMIKAELPQNVDMEIAKILNCREGIYVGGKRVK